MEMQKEEYSQFEQVLNDLYKKMGIEEKVFLYAMVYY